VINTYLSMIAMLRYALDRELNQAFVYVVWACEDKAAPGEFALPLHTSDLRQTIIDALGYECADGEWKILWDYLYEDLKEEVACEAAIGRVHEMTEAI
jgi:hypothetical protein